MDVGRAKRRTLAEYRLVQAAMVVQAAAAAAPTQRDEIKNRRRRDEHDKKKKNQMDREGRVVKETKRVAACIGQTRSVSQLGIGEVAVIMEI